MTSDLVQFLTEEGTPERCGIVTKRGKLIELDNVHAEPTKGFEMAPLDIIKNFRNAKATWHTHPGADPNLSEDDMAGFLQWPDLTHYIVGVRDGEALVLSFTVEDGVVLQT